jgi:hypothetical protein
MKLLREEPNRDARDDSLDRGTDNNPAKLISNFGGEPRGQTVDNAENRAEHYSY